MSAKCQKQTSLAIILNSEKSKVAPFYISALAEAGRRL